jgi:DNA-binding CsgD family transcriptional regulator
VASRGIWAVVEAFTASLDLERVLAEGHAAISGLVSADGVASCIARPASSNRFDLSFTKRGLPTIVAAVAIREADPIRTQLLARPTRLLGEDELGPLQTYEGSDVYRIATTFGDPVATMLSGAFLIDGARPAAFTVYRKSARAFSAAERARIQRVWPVIGTSIQNCSRFAELARCTDVLDGLFELQKLGVIVFDDLGREVMRNERAQALLDIWFDRVARGRHDLPDLLEERMRAFRRTAPFDAPPPLEVHRPGEAATLRVSFVALRARGDRQSLALVFELKDSDGQLPPQWARVLTPREIEVAVRVRCGLDNATIAAELDCAAGTVKKHVQNVLDKLGVDNRMALIAHGR